MHESNGQESGRAGRNDRLGRDAWRERPRILARRCVPLGPVSAHPSLFPLFSPVPLAARPPFVLVPLHTLPSPLVPLLPSRRLGPGRRPRRPAPGPCALRRDRSAFERNLKKMHGRGRCVHMGVWGCVESVRAFRAPRSRFWRTCRLRAGSPGEHGARAASQAGGPGDPGPRTSLRARGGRFRSIALQMPGSGGRPGTPSRSAAGARPRRAASEGAREGASGRGRERGEGGRGKTRGGEVGEGRRLRWW